MSKSVKSVLFIGKVTGGLYVSTNGSVRYRGSLGNWINVSSVPSTAKRLLAVNNFKEKPHA